MIVDAPECVNCGAALAGPWCAACGQRRQTRVTAGGLLRDAVEAFTSLEHGFDRTVLDLLRRPGSMIHDYLRGRTRPYTSPLKFAIIAAALAMILMLWLDVFDAERYMLLSYQINPEMDAQIGALNRVYLRFMNLFLLFMIPVSSLVTWSLFRRERLTLGEHVVFNAYAFGMATLLCAAGTIPLFYGLGAGDAARAGIGMLWMGVSTIYFVAACVLFFVGGIGRRVGLALLAAALSGTAYFVVTFGAMIGYAWLQTLG